MNSAGDAQVHDGRMPGQEVRIAVLDDYQRVALEMADWGPLRGRASIQVFADHISDRQKLIAELLPFDVICVMRERTPLTGEILSQLPRLKLIVSTGRTNASIDTGAASELGIALRSTTGSLIPPIELTWALILAAARHIVPEASGVRSGRWQHTVGQQLQGKTLGILGLGRIGLAVAHIGKAFGMNVITWRLRSGSSGLEGDISVVSKEEFFSQADFLSIHLALVEETRNIIGKAELAQMKPTAWIINTARGQLIRESDLIEALRAKTIAGAALDVFNTEPLPLEHPFRTLDNVLATPHLGYVSEEQYRVFYQETVAGIVDWLNAGA